ncbi:MAG: sigma-70 family RNA polymerase sigma factor [Planctomycetota bacterium]
MDRLSERELIGRVLGGEREAAATLIRAHQASLYAYMLRMCGKPEVAEDVVQEAFVRALTNLHRFDPRFRFSTWLFTIAKRLYLNAAQKSSPAFDTDRVGIAAGTGETPHAAAAEAEAHAVARSELGEALAMLPEVQREVLVLFHQCDWPIARIAEHLLIPEGTIKSHLHRGRRKLRAALTRVRLHAMSPVREAQP